MPTDAVLIATGADRPGILDELSQFLLECGGNITESRSINLRGQFALLLSVHGNEAALSRIHKGLPAMQAHGIIVELRPANEFNASAFPFVFIATGKDQAGVLHRISHLLRALSVNIETVQTRVSEDESFEIRLALAVPRETPITMLREYLTFLCEELKITGLLKDA
ncbi:MAG TPA: ACT domain-containing protein [Tepidisphaeraceae bacterium]|nr:ACT domain-containing protein [Tepidisphaeraceae bacterium]